MDHTVYSDIDAESLSLLLRVAATDVRFARMVIHVYVEKVKAGKDISPDLQDYIAGKLDNVLSTDSRGMARALGLVSGKRGPGSGHKFKSVGKDFWYASAVRTLKERMTHEDAVVQVAEISCCSESKIERACTRLKNVPLEPLGDNGQLSADVIKKLSKPMK